MSKTLSVIMMAYNQSAYILDAIDSVLQQNLPFEWELLIGDDCSQDNTQSVVLNYLVSNPNPNIKYIRHESNLGLHRNYEYLVKVSNGEFIALLEADDYWIDPDKCRLQIEMLKINFDIAWTFTNGIIIDQHKKIIREVNIAYPELMDLDYYIKNFFNPLSNTIVFRKASEPREYPSFFFQVRQWDTVLLYLRLLNETPKTNKIGYVPVNGLAWRRHDQAVSTTLFQGKQRYSDWLLIDKEIKKRMPIHLKKYFNRKYIAYEYLSLISLKEKSYLQFLYFLGLSIFNRPFRSLKEYRDYFWKIRSSSSI